jgi:hypothetical protein
MREAASRSLGKIKVAIVPIGWDFPRGDDLFLPTL